MNKIGSKFNSYIFADAVKFGRLYKPFEILYIYDYFVMNALENNICDRAGKVALVGSNDLYILGTDNNVNGFVLAKPLSEQVYLCPATRTL